MEIRHLVYFIAVAEELNFGRAAKRLQMTQPPLSQQIQQLERELRVVLFDRTKRSVALTAAGQVFLTEARAILHRVEDAVEQVRRADRGEVGELHVGFVGSATYDILPVVVREYRRRYPQVALSLVELATPKQLVAMQRGDIDVGILRPPIEGDFCVITVQQSPCMLAIPRGHPLAHVQPLRLVDTAQHAYVCIARQTWAGLYDEFLSLCNAAGFHPNIAQEAFEFQTVMGLVAAGVGIAFVPPSAQNLHAREVVYREVVDHRPLSAMAIAWRGVSDASPGPPLVENFIAIAQDWQQLT